MKMLTPKDLRNHQFQMSGRNGYLAADVDDYMDEVYNSYDQMFRENAEIVRKLQVLADRLAKYKDDEENIRNALVEAQRMKNSIIVEAQQKAQGQLSETEEKIRAARESVDAQSGEILDKARVEADEILKDARAEAAEIIERANKKATDLLATADAIYEEKVGSVAEEAAKLDLPVLARLPIDPQVAHLCDLGEIERVDGKAIADAVDVIEAQVGLLL